MFKVLKRFGIRTHTASIPAYKQRNRNQQQNTSLNHLYFCRPDHVFVRLL
jgi:hypothetical protein